MKIGTQTNSLINHIYSRAVIGQPEPVVGMGATMLHWTDRTPGTIFRVFAVGKSTFVEVREDNKTRTDENGMSDAQSYSFKTNVNGHARTFKRKANGQWVQVYKSNDTGRWLQSDGCGLRIGERSAYYDFSF